MFPGLLLRGPIIARFGARIDLLQDDQGSLKRSLHTARLSDSERPFTCIIVAITSPVNTGQCAADKQ